MSVSFMHRFPDLASYRYRAEAPAKWLGASLNDPMAETLVFVKPQAGEVEEARRALADGRTIVVDCQDNRFARLPHHMELLRLAHTVTVPTEVTQKIIASLGRCSMVIPEAYTYDRAEPHCNGDKLFWFGHPVNLKTLNDVAPIIRGYPLKVLCGVPGTMPWSHENMLEGLAWADIVILPTTDYHRSANRAVEAIRRGCFVVAEPHSSLAGFPVWVGNLREGIEWARSSPDAANRMIAEAQEYIEARFSPERVAPLWKSATRKVGLADPFYSRGWSVA